MSRAWNMREVRELRNELNKGSDADLQQLAERSGRTMRAVKAMALRQGVHVLKTEPSVHYGVVCKVCKQKLDWDETPKDPILLLESIKTWTQKHKTC